MTTGWMLVNIALVLVVAAIVAIPAVLVPMLLDRKTPSHAPQSAFTADFSDASQERRRAA